MMRQSACMTAIGLLILLASGCSDGARRGRDVAGESNGTGSPGSIDQAPADAASEPAANQEEPEPVTTTPPREDYVYESRNRLGDETSPYLLQHQANPVHWFPWGDEAFEAARALDRPIFLSIGYSTCYWCHVMERESFEDEAIAAFLNEHFICIKVDREERPDVDDIYMAAVQALTGRGGWPMSTFLEPQGLRPFLGGTYFPPEQFQGILQQVVGFWTNQRSDVINQAQQLANVVSERLRADAQPAGLARRDVEKALSGLLTTYDRIDGGFVGSPAKAPKFPTPVNLQFLLQAAWDLEPMRDAVLHTMDRMAMGGMYDQVGGGFHRYSVDAKWLVPHFEKMLYDNGQLASLYAEVHDRTGDPYYAEIVRETLDYVLREMVGPHGGFYSAQDAEVNHREGANYIWTSDEVTAALTDAGQAADVEFALRLYGVDAGPNFEDQHHPDDPRSVLFLRERPQELASQLDMTPDDFNARVDSINRTLLAVRDARDQPLTDDKVLTGWNGLMIAGMADGGRVLEEQRYIDAAERAARFILDQMRTDSGELLRTYRSGQARISGFLEDYALFVHGLLALHEATGNHRWLEMARDLTDEARSRFWDQSLGAYFDTLDGQSDLFVRVKSTYDGAVPCGNAVMVNNLLDLYRTTSDEKYLDDAVAALTGLSHRVSQQPMGAIYSTLALDRVLKSNPERFGQAPSGQPRGPVTLVPDRKSVTIADGRPATVNLNINIVDGYHMNAHEPGDETLIPFTVSVTGATGVAVRVNYPEGEMFSGPVGSMKVYQGRLSIPITIEKTGPVTGRARINVRFQVCDDQVCLAPGIQPLDLTIVVE